MNKRRRFKAKRRRAQARRDFLVARLADRACLYDIGTYDFTSNI